MAFVLLPLLKLSGPGQHTDPTLEQSGRTLDTSKCGPAKTHTCALPVLAEVESRECEHQASPSLICHERAHHR